tara:strand:+ start:2527 stop:4014 length:1488 start_codon:yes stop_codon:yes gene_type:complete
MRDGYIKKESKKDNIMKPIKKFSTIAKVADSINESADANHDAVMDLVKKMGYESIDELKKEKNLLTKLEGLLKDFTPKQDISEDELEEDRAEDIEDDVKKKGEPRSLESDKGEKKEDEVSTDGEVEEADTEEVEDLVSDEEEVTTEVPAEADEVEDEDDVEVASEEKETPAATKRIMAFEDFIKEKEVTVNKNVKYSDDAEEPEDYSVVAASADPLAEGDESKGKEDEKDGDELEDKGDKKVDSEDDKEKADHYAGAVKSDDSEIDALKKDVEFDKEEEDDAKKESRVMSFTNFVTEAYNKDDEDSVEEEDDSVEEDRAEDIEDEINAKGKTKKLTKSVKEGVAEVITKIEGDEIADEEAGADGIAIPAEKGDGSETAAGIAGDIMNMGKVKIQPETKGEELVTKDQKITQVIPDSPNAVSKDGIEIPLVKEGKINEKDITSADEFKEYAMAILKDAFGDDFDEAKATDVANGLIKKYGEDFGAMVGALQSTMGS